MPGWRTASGRPAAASAPDQQGLEGYRTIIDPHRRIALRLLLGLIGLVSGLTAASSWQTWLLFANRMSFGKAILSFTWISRSSSLSTRSSGWSLSYLFAAVLLSLLVAIAGALPVRGIAAAG